MSVVGTVDSLWRYPVKSMRGEELEEAFVGFAGVYGDRLFAFRSSARPKGFPFLTGRQNEQMLLYWPRFRHADRAAKPANLTEADNIGPGATPLFPDPADLAVDVETPSGEVFGVDDPVLMSLLDKPTGEPVRLTLLRSERAMTDCRPVSLFSLQTGRQLGDETGAAIDKRRFRAKYLHGPRVRCRLRRGHVCRPNATDRIQGCDLNSRTRRALQDDHARSRYGSAERAATTHGRSGPR